MTILDSTDPAENVALEPDEIIELQVEFMKKWFYENYENPVENMPWDEGDYVWILEPHITSDILYENFDGKVLHAVIDKAVDDLEDESHEWVKISDWQDFAK